MEFQIAEIECHLEMTMKMKNTEQNVLAKMDTSETSRIGHVRSHWKYVKIGYQFWYINYDLLILFLVLIQVDCLQGQSTSGKIHRFPREICKNEPKMTSSSCN